MFRPETEVEGDKRFRVVEELGNHEFSVGATPLVALFEVPFNLQFQISYQGVVFTRVRRIASVILSATVLADFRKNGAVCIGEKTTAHS